MIYLAFFLNAHNYGFLNCESKKLNQDVDTYLIHKGEIVGFTQP